MPPARDGFWPFRRRPDGARRAQEARDRLDSRQFYDAQFDDLVRDPAAVVRSISDHFRLPAPCDTSMTNELAKPTASKIWAPQ